MSNSRFHYSNRQGNKKLKFEKLDKYLNLIIVSVARAFEMAVAKTMKNVRRGKNQRKLKNIQKIGLLKSAVILRRVLEF